MAGALRPSSRCDPREVPERTMIEDKFGNPLYVDSTVLLWLSLGSAEAGYQNASAVLELSDLDPLK